MTLYLRKQYTSAQVELNLFLLM